MTLRQLEYFFRLCDNPRISEVSKDLEVSQPAVSLAIKALEEELNEQLFSRIGKKLILNERGRAFQGQTRQHFLALQDVADSFASDRLAGYLRIGASKTFSTYLLPQVVYDFQSAYPQAQIEKTSTNSSQIIQGLLTGALDIGFVESSVKEADLITEKIGEDELIVVTGDKTLQGGSRFIDTLLNKKWILREQGSGTRDVFLNTLSAMNLSPAIFLELPEFEEIKNILQDNPDTLSCISQRAVQNELATSRLYRVPITNIRFSRELLVVYHRNRYRSRLFDTFLDFAKEQFKT